MTHEIDEGLIEKMAEIGRQSAANQLQEQIRLLQWELNTLTGENPPVTELQKLSREAAHLKRVIHLQNRLIDKLRRKAELYEMDTLEVDVLNELAQVSGL